MRPSPPHPAPHERGFVLVGVVMFMLALTILGLSLFALSSYEAQFFVTSAAREQALQNSESGMELAKALIAEPGKDLSRLEVAHLAEGKMGVTSAMAYQWRSADANDTTSSGPVDWAKPMMIVVSARSGGVERTLQAKFLPGVAEDPYQRLLVAGQGVSVDTRNPTEPQLLGRVWQPVASGADTAWTNDVDWNGGRPVEVGAPPALLVDTFIDPKLPAIDPSTAPNTNLTNPAGYEIDLLGQAGSPVFFQSPASPTTNDAKDDPEYSQYSFYVNDHVDIFVQGVAVWVVGTPGTGGLQGACFKNLVKVHPKDSNPGTLVIVTKAGAQNRGLLFKGGLKVYDGVTVYLVSEGDVSIVHANDQDKRTMAGAISIVAGGRIVIGGPGLGYSFELDYDPTSMDALAEQLLGQGALPPVTGGTGASFVAVRPSWLETTPR